MDKEPERKKVYSKQEGFLKACSYCAYQERSQNEVRSKLYDWGLYPSDVELVISDLIQENFLNEERFANAYTLGKFRMKGWGKKKIKQGLKLKRVPDKIIANALKKIDEKQYIEKLRELIWKKKDSLKEKNHLKERYKLTQYALMKGYESDLIFDVLNNNKLT
ncbi:MAG: RecX family transcriptional regulator [Sphingobacteriales bacterium]|nr:RecX family transcriptional regulator [Sphingobacteriales bacterium]